MRPSACLLHIGSCPYDSSCTSEDDPPCVFTARNSLPITLNRMTTLRPPPLTLFDKYSGQEPQILYSTTVSVTGGEAHHGRASGIARSDDGQLVVDLRLPKALGGTGAGTNPEQLFAAGYAACFHGALSVLAARSAVRIRSASVDVTVDFARDPIDGLFVLNARKRMCICPASSAPSQRNWFARPSGFVRTRR